VILDKVFSGPQLITVVVDRDRKQADKEFRNLFKRAARGYFKRLWGVE